MCFMCEICKWDHIRMNATRSSGFLSPIWTLLHPSCFIPVDLKTKNLTSIMPSSLTALRAFHISLSLPHFSSQLDTDLQEHATEITKNEDISKKECGTSLPACNSTLSNTILRNKSSAWCCVLKNVRPFCCNTLSSTGKEENYTLFEAQRCHWCLVPSAFTALLSLAFQHSRVAFSSEAL